MNKPNTGFKYISPNNNTVFVNKINPVFNYILSSAFCGILLIALSFIAQRYDLPGLFVSFNSLNDGLIYFLFWILLGLTIIIVTSLFEKILKSKIIEFFISVLISSSFMAFIATDIQTSVEGLIVVFTLAGIVVGMIIFFVKQVLCRLKIY